ncbi:hypothetical protein FVE24_18430, partial [Parageobacillus sp. SY1]
MKRLIFILGITFGVLGSSLIFQTNAMAEEISGTASTESNVYQQKGEDSKTIDPIVAQDGTKDGINDQSTVNIRITPISDSVSILGAGTWDYLGSSTFYVTSQTFYSGGGDLKIIIKQPYIGPGYKWLYKLVEEDTVLNDTVATFEIPNDGKTYEVVFDVRSFVDGDNGKAELYLEKLTNLQYSVSTDWY